MSNAGPRRMRGARCVARGALLVGLLLVGACERGEAPDALVSSEHPEAGPGRWKAFRTGSGLGLSPEQRRRVAELEAIGYVSGSVEAPTRPVVPRYDGSRTADGPNLYSSGHGPEAVLVDMQGNELHRWHYAFRDAFPDHPRTDDPNAAYFRRVELRPDGSLLAIFEGMGLIALDWRSRLLWASPIPAHHDLEVLPGGEIYVLTREARLIPALHPDDPILEDFVSVLDAGGREQRRVSILEAFDRSAYREILSEREERSGDVFHTNSLRVLGPGAEAAHPALRTGDVLVSSRRIDTVASIDLDAGMVRWALRGGYRRQHDARLLRNGHLLLFDNSGLGDESRVLELDPATGDTLWQYRGDEADRFYSKWCGTAQRLWNGNTLITESDNGRAIEVSPDGEIVWEFHNPHRAGEDGRYIATLFELERLSPAVAAELPFSDDAASGR